MTIEELDRDCRFTFIILYRGWEMDNKGWVMDDGSVFTTRDGHIVQGMSTAEIEAKISETDLSLAGLKHALNCLRNKAAWEEE